MAILKAGKIAYDDELSSLKDSVKRLRISVSGKLPDGLDQLPGLLHCERNGTGAVLSVSGFEATLPERLRREWTADVEVEDLNLEEIFLELHHG